MNYLLLIMEYLIAFLLLLSKPYWKKMAQVGINHSMGFRTSKSMKNETNWKKAQMLSAGYCQITGVLLIILNTIINITLKVAIEYKSLIIVAINIIALIILVPLINSKIEK